VSGVQTSRNRGLASLFAIRWTTRNDSNANMPPFGIIDRFARVGFVTIPSADLYMPWPQHGAVVVNRVKGVCYG